MKMIFVAAQMEINGKFYAIADTIRTGQNLAAILQRYNTGVVHLCESRKQAKKIALAWNDDFARNGTSVFA